MKEADIRLPYRPDRMPHPEHLHRDGGDKAIRAGLTEVTALDAGLRALLRKTEPNRVFYYTFFKAVGLRCYGGDHRNDKEIAR